MTFQQELGSWFSPTQHHDVEAPPQIGATAPSTSKLTVGDGKPSVINFLRHCGCPWAEKNFRVMRSAAESNPNVRFVAVSHSEQDVTNRWVEEVGGAGPIEVVVDPDREVYAKWGLGIASFTHVLNPTAFSNMSEMGKTEGIKVRPTESGSRWQQSGSYAADSSGIVKYGGPAKNSDEVMDVDEAIKAIT